MNLKQEGATYMRDRNMLEVSRDQFFETGSNLWVRLICECDLYAKIYSNSQQGNHQGPGTQAVVVPRSLMVAKLGIMLLSHDPWE